MRNLVSHLKSGRDNWYDMGFTGFAVDAWQWSEPLLSNLQLGVYTKQLKKLHQAIRIHFGQPVEPGFSSLSALGQATHWQEAMLLLEDLKQQGEKNFISKDFFQKFTRWVLYHWPQWVMKHLQWGLEMLVILCIFVSVSRFVCQPRCQ